MIIPVDRDFVGRINMNNSLASLFVPFHQLIDQMSIPEDSPTFLRSRIDAIRPEWTNEQWVRSMFRSPVEHSSHISRSERHQGIRSNEEWGWGWVKGKDISTRRTAVELFRREEFFFVLAGEFDIVTDSHLIRLERLSDEDREFLLVCRTEIVPSWTLLIIDLNGCSEEFARQKWSLYRVWFDMNANVNDLHVLQISVDHFQCQSNRAKIGLAEGHCFERKPRRSKDWICLCPS